VFLANPRSVFRDASRGSKIHVILKRVGFAKLLQNGSREEARANLELQTRVVSG